MKTNRLLLVFALTITFIAPLSAQQTSLLSPEEKAQQIALTMQKRLGLKEIQITKVYTLNLTKIQQVRTVKSRDFNPKRLDHNYKEINEAYNSSLRGILTPEQYQRWENIKDEVKNRQMMRQKYQEKADNNQPVGDETTDLETALNGIVTE